MRLNRYQLIVSSLTFLLITQTDSFAAKAKENCDGAEKLAEQPSAGTPTPVRRPKPKTQKIVAPESAQSKWYNTTAGQLFLSSPEGRRWEEEHPGLEEVPPQLGGKGRKGQPARPARDAADEAPVSNWRHSTAGNAWASSPQGKRWLREHPGETPPQFRDDYEAPAPAPVPARQSLMQPSWMHSTAGQAFLETPAGKRWVEERGYETPPMFRDDYQEPEPVEQEPILMSWMHSTAGQFFLNSPMGRRWVREHPGEVPPQFRY